MLALSAVPPPGTRWLEMPVSPGRSIRIDLTGAPAVQVRHEHHPAPPLGELLLGAVAETMLGGGQLVGMTATLLASGLAEVAEALTAVGLLAAAQPGRQPAGRTLRAAGHRGPRSAGQPGPGRQAPRALGQCAQRQPPGGRPAGHVEPPPQSCRRSTEPGSSWPACRPGNATPPCSSSPGAGRTRPREFRPQQPFSWWARDDAGRWHVGRVAIHDAAPGTFQLELTPPLHPAARSLDIILTGRAGQVTATLPLAWTGRLAEPQDQDISY